MTDLSETLEGQTWLDMESLEQVLKVCTYNFLQENLVLQFFSLC
jgi:hypothetical protein